jgi:hypothetical protein
MEALNASLTIALRALISRIHGKLLNTVLSKHKFSFLDFLICYNINHDWTMCLAIIGLDVLDHLKELKSKSN